MTVKISPSVEGAPFGSNIVDADTALFIVNEISVLPIENLSQRWRSLPRETVRFCTFLGPWRVKRETCEKGAIRCSGFEVPKTSNCGPRTVVCLTPPASLTCLTRLSYGVRTITNRQETVPTGAIIAIASGWGGVGEGEIAANLALLLAKKDTGVVLADLHLGGMDRTKLSARGRL
jgi:hypothetical protein